MDSLTSLILSEIKRQYKSVRKFSQETDIPQTTISSALKNGVSGTAYGTVVRICEKLNIESANHMIPFHADQNALKLLAVYSRLDNKGRHTVHAVLKTEYERCVSGRDSYDLSTINVE